MGNEKEIHALEESKKNIVIRLHLNYWGSYPAGLNMSCVRLV